MRSTEKRVQEFWECWMKRRFGVRNRTHSQENVEVGLVLETHPGKDGLVRKAKIKTATSVYNRPIHKLCLIATKEELNSTI